MQICFFCRHSWVHTPYTSGYPINLYRHKHTCFLNVIIQRVCVLTCKWQVQILVQSFLTADTEQNWAIFKSFLKCWGTETNPHTQWNPWLLCKQVEVRGPVPLWQLGGEWGGASGSETHVGCEAVTQSQSLSFSPARLCKWFFSPPIWCLHPLPFSLRLNQFSLPAPHTTHIQPQRLQKQTLFAILFWQDIGKTRVCGESNCFAFHSFLRMICFNWPPKNLRHLETFSSLGKVTQSA